MKNNLMRTVFFIISAILIFLIFFDLGNKAKVDQFYKNEIVPLELNETYVDTLINNISDEYVDAPIFKDNFTTEDSNFDLSVYLFLNNSNVNLLFFANNANILNNGAALDEFSIVFDIYVKSELHSYSQTMSFNKDKEKTLPYFVISELNNHFQTTIGKQAYTFDVINEIRMSIKTNDGKVIGNEMQLKLDENAEIKVNNTLEDSLNSNLENYHLSKITYKESDNSLFKQYNTVFYTYIIVYVLFIGIVAFLTFYREKISSLFKKKNNKKTKTVTGTIE